MQTLCIYHAHCADGFGAAWVVRKALGDDVEFFPGTYREPPPDATGRDLILVDFSYPRDVMLALAAKARSITVLDHHKSAAADLVDLPDNVRTTFDMSRSGAMLAWLHFFPGEAPPQLLLHIEDRDLWRFALPQTREIGAALFSYPQEFPLWDTLMSADVTALAADGAAIERKHTKDVHGLLKVTTREMEIAGHRILVANLPSTMASEAGHELAQGRPFGATYFDGPGIRNFSLRSTDAGIDVSEIAAQFGGGGHRNAAGFRIPFAQAQAFEVQA